jgi:alanyl-tRNA synthetase
MKSAEIRSSFLEYFKSKGHAIVASSSLVPANDPTLLFVNSGMVQFKDVFLGKEKRAYVRADDLPAMRARGRQAQRPGERRLHRAPPHLLRDAGQLQLRRLLQEGRHPVRLGAAHQGLQAAAERLWATVYETDDEAYDLWTKTIGVPKERVHPHRRQAGRREIPVGQLLADGRHRPLRPLAARSSTTTARASRAGPPGSADADGDRYIEIWNLVFMHTTGTTRA